MSKPKVRRKSLISFDPERSFKVDVADIKLGKCIGSGAFSQVYKGLYQGQTVAVKKQIVEDATNVDKYLKKELKVLKTIAHPNLLRFVGANIVGKYMHIVTEFMEGGDLRQLVVKSLPNVKNNIGNKTLVQMLLDVTSALAYLHERELMHRDIKTDNIVLDGSLRAVLCDFGFARKASKSNQMAMTICGTDEFMAPEVIFGMEYGLAADMFSMGVVACEMICRKVVGDQGFLVRTPQGSFGVDINEVKHHIHGTPPSSLMMWIEQCLSNEAEDRINAVDAEGWLRDLIDELPKDEVELVLDGNGPTWKIKDDSVQSPTDNNNKDVNDVNDVNDNKDVNNVNDVNDVNDTNVSDDDVDVPIVPPRSSIARTKPTTSSNVTETPELLETKTEQTVCATKPKEQLPTSVKKKTKIQTTPCSAPSCEALQRHASGFCPLHAYLRQFKHVMYATKRGYKRKTWRRRFFCLNEHELQYFKTMESVRKNRKPQGIIKLTDTVLLGGNQFIDSVEDPKVTKDRKNCARLHTTARTYYFQFDTVEERTAFIEKIKPLRR